MKAALISAVGVLVIGGLLWAAALVVVPKIHGDDEYVHKPSLEDVRWAEEFCAVGRDPYSDEYKRCVEDRSENPRIGR